MERLQNGDIVVHFKRYQWLERYDVLDEENLDLLHVFKTQLIGTKS